MLAMIEGIWTIMYGTSLRVANDEQERDADVY